MMNILVIGNGLSAATFSYFAHKEGHNIFRIYYDSTIGGLCEDAWDPKHSAYISRSGPHIFHTSDLEVWRWVNSIAPFMTYQNSPKALYKGKFYSLPFNLNTMQQVFGVQTSSEARCKIDADRKIYKNPKNAEEMAKSSVGETFFEMFQKSYTEKQWKRPASKVSPGILARVPVRYTYNDNYFNDLFQGLPIDGYTNFIKEIFEKSKATFIQCQVGEFDYNKIASLYNIDKIVICDRPDLWLGKELNYEMIPYGCTKFSRVDSRLWSQDAAVVNHCDNTRDCTRTTDYALLTSKITTIPGLLQSETPLGELSKNEFAKSCFIPYEQEVVACYPTSSIIYEKYKIFAEEKGIILCGRLAENKYLNMDQAIINAKDKVYKFLRGDKNDRVYESSGC